MSAVFLKEKDILVLHVTHSTRAGGAGNTMRLPFALPRAVRIKSSRKNYRGSR